MAKEESIKVSTLLSGILTTVVNTPLSTVFYNYFKNGIWTMMLGFKSSYVIQNVRDDYRIYRETNHTPSKMRLHL